MRKVSKQSPSSKLRIFNYIQNLSRTLKVFFILKCISMIVEILNIAAETVASKNHEQNISFLPDS